MWGNLFQSLGNFITGHGFQDNQGRANEDARNAIQQQQSTTTVVIQRPVSTPQPFNAPVFNNPFQPLQTPTVPTPPTPQRPLFSNPATTNPITNKPDFSLPIPSALVYKGHDLSGLNGENQAQAKRVIDNAAPGYDLNPYFTSKRKEQELRSKSDYENSFGGKVSNFVGGLPSAAKQVLVDPLVNTARLPADLFMSGIGAITGNTGLSSRANAALSENFNKSYLAPLNFIAPLGASIAYNEQYDKITKDLNTTPEMKNYLLANLENSINQETAKAGVGTNQPTWQNALNIGLGAAGTAITVATAPGMIESLINSFRPTPSGVMLNDGSTALSTNPPNSVPASVKADLATALREGDMDKFREAASRTWPQMQDNLNNFANQFEGKVTTPPKTPVVTNNPITSPLDVSGIPQKPQAVIPLDRGGSISAPVRPETMPTPVAPVVVPQLNTPSAMPVAPPQVNVPSPSILAQQMAPTVAPKPIPAGRELTSDYVRVGYPNAADLPTATLDTIKDHMNFSNKTSIEDRIASNKLTPRDIENVKGAFSQSDIKMIADNVPSFKENPVMTYNPEGQIPTITYNGDITYETAPTFEYNVGGQKMSISAEKAMPNTDLSYLKPGEQVDFSQALGKGNNKIPAITESKPGEPLPETTPAIEGEVLTGKEVAKPTFDETRLEKRILEPGTGGNPTDRYSLQIRYKGWAADEQLFVTKEQAQKAMDSYVFKGLNESVLPEYVNMKQKYPDFPINFKQGESASQVTKTQTQVVSDVIAEEGKSIKQIADETSILEPNVRRILGVGAKDGTFERVGKGVYVLNNNGQDIAYVHSGDAMETLTDLAQKGFKSDMVFLDIPYKTPAVTGGNRGVKYETISPTQFDSLLTSVDSIARTADSPIVYMYSQAKSGVQVMQKYTDQLLNHGFKPIGRGEYTKLQQDGITQVRNMRGDVIVPEGIIVFNKSGELNPNITNLNFRLVRPKGYQTEKPAEMLKSLIEMTTNEGDVVLDPFAGSGVTGEQAIKTGRRTVLVEKDPNAVENIIKPRIEEAVKSTPKPVSTTVLKPKPVAAPIVQKPVKSPILDETGAPRPITQPKATTDLANRSKQKSLADRKRGIAEIRRIVGDHAVTDVYTITNPNGRKAGVYQPANSRIGIKGVGELNTYRHEAMHKAFAENLVPEQQAAIFKAILRENGVENVDFANMKDSEISALIGNADEKLNYSISRYLEDTNNIKDTELNQYFKDIMAGRYAGRQAQNAKVWSQTGVDKIKQYLIGEGKVGYKEVAPKLSNPSEKTARQVAGQIARSKKADADYTPNREVAKSTGLDRFMRRFIDREVPFINALKRMDKDLNINNGMGSKAQELLNERKNVRNKVQDEMRNQPDSKIYQFKEIMKTNSPGGALVKMREFSELLKLKSTANDKANGLVINDNYYKPDRQAELESKYQSELTAYQAIFDDVRQEIKPFLTREAADAMNHNEFYIPMRRDFTDASKADIFTGKAKSTENVAARQNVIKSKQGGSTKDILDPVDTMLQMYIGAKQTSLDNKIISGIADPRYGFKRIGKYTDVPDGMIKMTYFKDGMSHAIAVPEEMGAAFAPRIPKKMSENIVHKVAAAATIPIRAAATGINVAWQATNPGRDMLSNVIRTNHSMGFIADIPKGIWTAVSGKGELADIGRRTGIMNNTSFSNELSQVPQNMLSEVLNSSGTKGIVIDAVKHPISTVKAALNIGENMTRLAELNTQLRAGRQKGLSGMELERYAMTEANKHLPDYSKSGTVTAIVNAYKPYMTASVAGVRPLYRAFKDRPGQTIAKAGALVAASVVIALAQGSDDKTGETYDSLTDDEKNRNLNFVMSDKVGEDGKANTIKVRLSPDLYGLNTLGNVIANLVRGRLDANGVKDLVSETMNSATPINLALGDKENAIYSVINSVIPSVLSTALQTAFGIDYKGSKQYESYASDWAKTISDAIGKTLKPEQIQQLGAGLLGNFTKPEKLVDIKSGFTGSYTKPGTPVNTSVDGKEVKIYKPVGDSIKRIKAEEGDWYEVTAGNDLAKDNGKIKRLDEQSPVYTDSVEGLSKKDVNMLAMTRDEVTRDLKSNKYDGTVNYLSALKNAEDRDIATKDEKHDYYGKSLTTTQALAVAGVNKDGNYDYDFQNLYNEIDLSEWRDLGDPESDNQNIELYNKLYDYDSERAAVDGSDASSDTSKNKYYVKKSGSGSGYGSGSGKNTFSGLSFAKPLSDNSTGIKSQGLSVATNPFANLVKSAPNTQTSLRKNISVSKGVKL